MAETPPAVTLRPVQPADIERFFEHQQDSVAVAMAAFPARGRDEHFAHWARIVADTTGVARTIEAQGEVVGDIVGWLDGQRRLLGYWIGRQHWGRGLATEALRQFVHLLPERPLYAYVALANIGSQRVLEKAGFVRDAERGVIRAADGVDEYLYVLA